MLFWCVVARDEITSCFSEETIDPEQCQFRGILTTS